MRRTLRPSPSVPASVLVAALLSAGMLAGCGAVVTPADAPAPGATTPGTGARPTSSATTTPTTAPTTGPATGRSIVTIRGNEALRWGSGPYGVVLAHGSSYDAASWDPQGPEFAARGATVVAVENISPDAIVDAVEYLRANGIARVALVGGSAGADAILQVASAHPDLADQLVLLSPNQVVQGLGSEPKLIVASAQEPRVGAAREIAGSSPGDHNRVVVVPGKAHAQAILKHDKDGSVLRLILRRLD